MTKETDLFIKYTKKIAARRCDISNVRFCRYKNKNYILFVHMGFGFASELYIKKFIGITFVREKIVEMMVAHSAYNEMTKNGLR